jgi:bifunctional non-homologous end joining protein LigD
VQPTLVVEVEFTAWTTDGRLRQPVFRGVRGDKSVDEARGDG